MQTVPGTPADEAESLVSIPLIARASIKGALNVYRLGESASFDDDEFELLTRFADAAALALDNAQGRSRLRRRLPPRRRGVRRDHVRVRFRGLARTRGAPAHAHQRSRVRARG